tara:strand:+ start:3373 stop:7368 length:3996 start_codon:yes stop_codon:yes gene_type:complete
MAYVDDPGTTRPRRPINVGQNIAQDSASIDLSPVAEGPIYTTSSATASAGATSTSTAAHTPFGEIKEYEEKKEKEAILTRAKLNGLRARTARTFGPEEDIDIGQEVVLTQDVDYEGLNLSKFLDQGFKEGDTVFVQQGKTDTEGRTTYHVTKPGETIVTTRQVDAGSPFGKILERQTEKTTTSFTATSPFGPIYDIKKTTLYPGKTPTFTLESGEKFEAPGFMAGIKKPPVTRTLTETKTETKTKKITPPVRLDDILRTSGWDKKSQTERNIERLGMEDTITADIMRSAERRESRKYMGIELGSLINVGAMFTAGMTGEYEKLYGDLKTIRMDEEVFGPPQSMEARRRRERLRAKTHVPDVLQIGLGAATRRGPGLRNIETAGVGQAFRSTESRTATLPASYKAGAAFGFILGGALGGVVARGAAVGTARVGRYGVKFGKLIKGDTSPILGRKSSYITKIIDTGPNPFLTKGKISVSDKGKALFKVTDTPKIISSKGTSEIKIIKEYGKTGKYKHASPLTKELRNILGTGIEKTGKGIEKGASIFSRITMTGPKKIFIDTKTTGKATARGFGKIGIDTKDTIKLIQKRVGVTPDDPLFFDKRLPKFGVKGIVTDLPISRVWAKDKTGKDILVEASKTAQKTKIFDEQTSAKLSKEFNQGFNRLFQMKHKITGVSRTLRKPRFKPTREYKDTLKTYTPELAAQMQKLPKDKLMSEKLTRTTFTDMFRAGERGVRRTAPETEIGETLIGGHAGRIKDIFRIKVGREGQTSTTPSRFVDQLVDVGKQYTTPARQRGEQFIKVEKFFGWKKTKGKKLLAAKRQVEDIGKLGFEESRVNIAKIMRRQADDPLEPKIIPLVEKAFVQITQKGPARVRQKTGDIITTVIDKTPYGRTKTKTITTTHRPIELTGRTISKDLVFKETGRAGGLIIDRGLAVRGGTKDKFVDLGIFGFEKAAGKFPGTLQKTISAPVKKVLHKYRLPYSTGKGTVKPSTVKRPVDNIIGKGPITKLVDDKITGTIGKGTKQLDDVLKPGQEVIDITRGISPHRGAARGTLDALYSGTKIGAIRTGITTPISSPKITPIDPFPIAKPTPPKEIEIIKIKDIQKEKPVIDVPQIITPVPRVGIDITQEIGTRQQPAEIYPRPIQIQKDKTSEDFWFKQEDIIKEITAEKPSIKQIVVPGDIIDEIPIVGPPTLIPILKDIPDTTEKIIVDTPTKETTSTTDKTEQIITEIPPPFIPTPNGYFTLTTSTVIPPHKGPIFGPPLRRGALTDSRKKKKRILKKRVTKNPIAEQLALWGESSDLFTFGKPAKTKKKTKKKNTPKTKNHKKKRNKKRR